MDMARMCFKQRLEATISSMFDGRLKVQIGLVTSNMAGFLCLPLAFCSIVTGVPKRSSELQRISTHQAMDVDFQPTVSYGIHLKDYPQ